MNDRPDKQRQASRQSLLSRGTSQSGVRLYNERLALSLIRRHQSLPKAEIARLTGLSAQTVSVIVRQLESDGLLIREKPRRGKVGQPLVPFSLNPDGAFSVGLKVGRRSGDLMLLDLTGKVRHTLHQPYHVPTPAELLKFVEEGTETLIAELKPRERGRIAGLGIAAPFEPWYGDEHGKPPGEAMEAWRGFDLAAEIGKLLGWPIHLCNDATAACAAELLFGKGRDYRDYGYFYIGYFAGGGVVINGSLYQGRSGNAGALGSIPVPSGGGGSQQLIGAASLCVLERELIQAGSDPAVLWRSTEDWPDLGPALERWIDGAALGLAHAAAAVASVIESSAIVIDGAMPANVRARLVERASERLAEVNTRWISPFTITAGTIGSQARAMGAASLPLFANFIIDRDVLFKESA